MSDNRAQMGMGALALNPAVVQRSPNQIACDMGGEVVILDVKSGTYYGLDALGSMVWSLIEQPMSLAAIRDAIIADYDVDAETCERDIVKFLREMETVGLIEVNGGSYL